MVFLDTSNMRLEVRNLLRRLRLCTGSTSADHSLYFPCRPSNARAFHTIGKTTMPIPPRCPAYLRDFFRRLRLPCGFANLSRVRFSCAVFRFRCFCHFGIGTAGDAFVNLSDRSVCRTATRLKSTAALALVLLSTYKNIDLFD